MIRNDDKLLECLDNVYHEKLHSKGTDHYHPGTTKSPRHSHHGNGEKHHDYTPGKHGDAVEEHSHLHLREAAGDSLGMLDRGSHEIGMAAHVSSTSPLSDPGTGNDIRSEMGDFLELFVGSM